MKQIENVKGFKQYFILTFFIGFGFFTMGLMDPLYDTYVPIFLKKYISSNALIGALMTLDNVLQLFLIPLVSVWSDRTRTRIGRRMPFIIVMLPASAVFFALIPSMAAWALLPLVVILFIFNIFKTSVRGPVVALMPDTIPGDYRSEANGVINTMGGIGLIVGTLGLARLMNIRASLPFLVASLCIFLATILLFFLVKEKPQGPEREDEIPVSIIASLGQVFAERGTGILRILFSIFFWFLAYEGVKPFLGLYLVDTMNVSAGNAALAQGVAGIASVALAIPTGYLAHRMGRRNFIRRCLLGLALILALIPLTALLARTLHLSTGGALALFLLLMFLYGAVWIGVVVNSFPMLWQMATYGNMGIYTGLYYTFSQTAAIAAPPITGAIIDSPIGYPGIFLFAALCMVAAYFIMAGVKKGEANP